MKFWIVLKRVHFDQYNEFHLKLTSFGNSNTRACWKSSFCPKRIYFYCKFSSVRNHRILLWTKESSFPTLVLVCRWLSYSFRSCRNQFQCPLLLLDTDLKFGRWIWIWRGFLKDTLIPTSLHRNSWVMSVTSWLQHQYEITTIWLYFYIFLFSRKWVVHRASLDRPTIFSKSLVSSRAPGSRVFWGEILTIVVTISMMNNHLFCLQVHLSFPIFLQQI